MVHVTLWQRLVCYFVIINTVIIQSAVCVMNSKGSGKPTFLITRLEFDDLQELS